MFLNRTDAGHRLADRLRHLRGEDVVVVGLPRGGVPVAYEIAKALDAPLDVILVRKLGVPFQPELAMGAIGEDGVRVVSDAVVRMARVSPAELAAVEQREQVELERRARRYRQGRPRVGLAGRVVVVVDDGIATGSTAKAACQVARMQGASRIILAAPVAPTDWTDRLAGAADELIALSTPEPFFGIGQFYLDFGQISDEEVIVCLNHGSRSTPKSNIAAGDRDVVIQIGAVSLGGHLTVPEEALGVVIFAHGSGSSRHSPRNRMVASILNEAGLATLLFDLLTAEEEATRTNVFDIELLTRRLVDVTGWARRRPELADLA
ncbi:MAG: phosphoribosyltransferase family protein, partial [Acidimicrobiales bacterium]